VRLEDGVRALAFGQLLLQVAHVEVFAEDLVTVEKKDQVVFELHQLGFHAFLLLVQHHIVLERALVVLGVHTFSDVLEERSQVGDHQESRLVL